MSLVYAITAFSSISASEQLLDRLADQTPAKSSESTLKEIANRREWTVLLPDETSDPLAELKSSLAAFASPKETKVGVFQLHPQCAYPARYHVLKSALSLQYDVECPELNQWKKSLGAHAVALIYAAPYLGNPASMFGHTFLKIGSDRSALLDIGVSFDAIARPDSPLVYAIKGLTGGYAGAYSQQPYYEKVQSYSHIEDRDLWEYDLILSDAQIDQLLNFLWEAASQPSAYFFINKNCSYRLLKLLEAANPGWRLSTGSQFEIMTIPLDTVRELRRVNGIGNVKARPSLLSQLQNRLRDMDRDRLKDFRRLRDDPTHPKPNEKPEVIDAVLDWQRRFSTTLNLELLEARASQTESYIESTNKPPPPELGHGSSKLGASVANDDGRMDWAIEFRPALHDSLDRDLGYIPNSTLQLATLSLGIDQKERRVYLDHFIFADLENLSPLSELARKPSWHVTADLYRPQDLGCQICTAAQVRLGLGLSKDLITQHNYELTAFTFANGQAEYSESYRDFANTGFRLGPSFEAGLSMRLPNEFKLRAAAEKFYYFPSDSIAQTSTFSKITSAISAGYLTYELRVSSEFWILSNRTFINSKLTLSQYF
jgi:hypothetical protein